MSFHFALLAIGWPTTISRVIAAMPAKEAGGYISIWKLIPVVLILLGWARLLAWADKDAIIARLPREWINLGLLCGMILAAVLVFFVPVYAIGLALFVLIVIVEIGAYLAMRHSSVGLGDLRESFAAWRKGIAPGKAAEAPAGSVLVMGPQNQPLPVPGIESAGRLGYDGSQQLLAEALEKNSERIELIPAADGTYHLRYAVDGMTYSGPGMEKSMAGEAIRYMKRGAQLSLEERRKPQRGTVKVMMDGKRRELEVSTAGSTAGEFLRIVVEPRKQHAFKLEELGFTAEQLEVVKNCIRGEKGVILAAAPKGQGLTSLLYGLMRGHDAFVENIQTIERAPDQEVEGVTVNSLPANAPPAEELKKVDWVLSQLPDVVMINQVEEPRAAVALAKYAGEGKTVYVAVRAGSTFDALAQWRRLVGDDRLAMKNLQMVIAGRVIRRLCAACKIAFNPDPEALRRLNINPSKADHFFAARKEPMRNSKGVPVPCDFCHNLRYAGRTGVYEVLKIDDEIRGLVQGGASVNQLKAVFRKQRGKYLQEAAFSLVESGETSIEEVIRAMKAGEAAPSQAARPKAG